MSINRLSLIVITKNEEDVLEDCLRSAMPVADEIIVVDSGSTDRTTELARSLGAKVFQTDSWPGFGPQKAYALSLASGDWVLSLDADERLSENLVNEIKKVILNGASTVDGYLLPRINYFIEQPLRWGGWGGDRLLRLGLRQRVRFSNDLIHERLIATGVVSKLSNPIIHKARRSLSQALEKNNLYINQAAEYTLSPTPRSYRFIFPILSIFHALKTFLFYYVFRLGLLDGTAGFYAATLRAQSKFWIHSGLGVKK